MLCETVDTKNIYNPKYTYLLNENQITYFSSVS